MSTHHLERQFPPTFHIAVDEIADAVRGEPDLQRQMEQAFRLARDHGWLGDEQERFKAGVAAFGACHRDDPKLLDRIRRDMEMLATIGAAVSGVPVDMGALASQPAYEPVGLLRAWHRVRDEERVKAADNIGPKPTRAAGDATAVLGRQLLALRWFTTPQRGGTFIGIVGLADRTGPVPYFKVYIGLARGDDPDADAEAIARDGARVPEELARFLVGDHPLFAGLEHMP